MIIPRCSKCGKVSIKTKCLKCRYTYKPSFTVKCIICKKWSKSTNEKYLTEDYKCRKCR